MNSDFNPFATAAGHGPAAAVSGSSADDAPDALPNLRTLNMHTFQARFERVAAQARRYQLPQSDVLLPAEGMVAGSDGLLLHFLEWPTRSLWDATLLFLHGGGLQAHSFDIPALFVRTRLRTLALDLRGHGDSDWASVDGYGWSHLADDIDVVVRQLTDRPVVLVGHSLGGLGALTWAARRPPQVRGLVLVDIGATINDGASQSIGRLITRHVDYGDLDEAESDLRNDIKRSDLSLSGVASGLRWNDEGRLTWKHDPSQFSGAKIDASGRSHLLAQAALVRCPALILRGARSRVLSDDGARELATAFPDGQWERISRAGHTIHTGNPVGFAAAVHRFLDRVGVAPNHSGDSSRPGGGCNGY